MLTLNTIADLHIHSNASDSTDTPIQLVNELVRKNIGLASLTDHNTIENQKLFLELAKKKGITAIPGVEISSKIDDMDYHILAYNFNPGDERISEYVTPLLSMMRDNGRQIIMKMIPDYPVLSISEYDSFRHDPNLGGWKFIQYLYKKGITENAIDGLAFRKIYNNPFTLDDYPSPMEVIQKIHSWGAYAVLAHPRGYFRHETPDSDSITKLFNEMKDFGIDGIECYYPKNTDIMTQTSVEWCKKNKMIITAGCDSHGSFVPGREIGKLRIPLSKLNINLLLEDKNHDK